MLDRAWRSGFKTKSNLAKSAADIVAFAASDGLITTKVAGGVFGTVWRITPSGVRHLWAHKGM